MSIIRLQKRTYVFCSLSSFLYRNVANDETRIGLLHIADRHEEKEANDKNIHAHRRRRKKTKGTKEERIDDDNKKNIMLLHKHVTFFCAEITLNLQIKMKPSTRSEKKAAFAY